MPSAWPDLHHIGDVLAFLVLAGVVVPVVRIDVRERRIPDVIVLPAVGVCSVVRAAWGSAPVWAVLGWGAVACAFLLLPALLRPAGMGLGDAKLAALIGVALGAVAIVAVFLALIAGAVGGAIWAFWRRVPVRATTIPFGPFLIVAAIAVGVPAALLH